jgi:hypothetical protein
MIKKIFLLLLVCLFFINNAEAKKGYTSYKSSAKPYKVKSYHPESYKSSSYKKNIANKPTYKIGNTKYIMGESYKNGKPKVERNSTVKKKFLKNRGYDKTPYGYEVDHVIPLHKGGADEPYNMQLLPREMHKQKTAREKRSN